MLMIHCLRLGYLRYTAFRQEGYDAIQPLTSNTGIAMRDTGNQRCFVAFSLSEDACLIPDHSGDLLHGKESNINESIDLILRILIT